MEREGQPRDLCGMVLEGCGAGFELDEALAKASASTRRRLGQSTEVTTALAALDRLIAQPDSPEGLIAKRAFLAYVVHKDPDLRAHMATSDRDRDLCTRVLPLHVPVFVADFAQRPLEFLAALSTTLFLFATNDLGAATG